MNSDEIQIRQLIDTWLRASAAGDSPALERLMAEDVVFLLPGRPPMTGRDEFMSAFNAGIGQFRMEAASEIKEIQVAGDFAWCWTHLTVTVTPASGKVMRRS
ncbi:MAG TPA: nuclear transport factor 2 family protein, partial [Verrucomicrobiales bacterium]|nr:nuclear transport factor 2 family protein [Verrucomicrobiales bacterium]